MTLTISKKDLDANLTMFKESIADIQFEEERMEKINAQIDVFLHGWNTNKDVINGEIRSKYGSSSLMRENVILRSQLYDLISSFGVENLYEYDASCNNYTGESLDVNDVTRACSKVSWGKTKRKRKHAFQKTTKKRKTKRKQRKIKHKHNYLS
jgi:hypothetical protein